MQRPNKETEGDQKGLISLSRVSRVAQRTRTRLQKKVERGIITAPVFQEISSISLSSSWLSPFAS